MRTVQTTFAVAAILLTQCEDVTVTNTPLPVRSMEVIQPFLIHDRIQVKTNNPFDDFQLVVQVPEGKTLIADYVSATVFGDVQEEEEFLLFISGSAKLTPPAQRPRHFVTKLTRIERVSRVGTHFVIHLGGGSVTTYAESSRPGFNSSLLISVSSNIAVGETHGTPREMFADVEFSGRLVDAV